ncbi:DUF1194 domain-containing protein [Arenibacterium sp. CAU 1754]
MQLVLAVDISFSISLDEQDIQRRGYVAAFRDPDVIRAITSGKYGRIAVTLFEWAGDDMQAQVVPWTEISDPVSARAFAAQLEQAPIHRSGRTSISTALATAIDLFPQSPFMAQRHVVDISSDGLNNSGPRVDRVRDRLVYQGIIINGLPLMMGKATGPEADLDIYFQDCVVGGFGSFVSPVFSWEEFGPTLKKKLIDEISGPGPERLFLAGAAMDCLIGEKEERRKYIDQLKDAVGDDRAPRWLPRDEDWPLPE